MKAVSFSLTRLVGDGWWSHRSPRPLFLIPAFLVLELGMGHGPLTLQSVLCIHVCTSEEVVVYNLHYVVERAGGSLWVNNYCV